MIFRNLKKELLYKMYVIENKSTCEISRQLNIPIPTIYWNLKHFKISVRSWGEAKKLNWNDIVYKQIMIEKHMGHVHTEEHKEKISKALKGKLPKNFNLLWTKFRKKCIDNMPRGQNHFNWRGGFDRKDYPYMFNKKLKELIRNRDGHKCQLCNAPECEFKGKLSVHHIDYDKKNIKANNLISLCKYCHTKTNYNRLHWIELFTKKLKELYGLDRTTITN